MTDSPGTADFDVKTAASRASAFVYGNILVLAALLAVPPGQVGTFAGVGYVLGTGVSTFVAHLVGETVADSIRGGNGSSSAEIRRHVRNSAPIASSASIPAALLAAVWLGWLPPVPAVVAALVFPIGRVAFLGALISHYHGERSVRAIVSGIVLAVVCAVAAALKFALTH